MPKPKKNPPKVKSKSSQEDLSEFRIQAVKLRAERLCEICKELSDIASWLFDEAGLWFEPDELLNICDAGELEAYEWMIQLIKKRDAVIEGQKKRMLAFKKLTPEERELLGVKLVDGIE